MQLWSICVIKSFFASKICASNVLELNNISISWRRIVRRIFNILISVQHNNVMFVNISQHAFNANQKQNVSNTSFIEKSSKKQFLCTGLCMRLIRQMQCKRLNSNDIIKNNLIAKFNNMRPASNVYIYFISGIFVILALFVLYVVFLHPFAKFVSIFMSISIWYAIIPIAPFILFVSGFVFCFKRERHPEG